MRLVTLLPHHDLRLVQSFARSIEAAGFDGVAAPENRHNPFVALAAAALATQRVQLGTAVAMAFPRSPTVTAMEAWDIHAASGGRFYLGLGSQVKSHIERRYGMAWTAPEPRMRDYVGATRALWRCWETQQPMDFHSDSYSLTLMTPNFAPEPTGLPPPPIAIGAVGPAMLRLAGECCDGVRLHPFSTRKFLAEFSAVQIAEGLNRCGRSRADIEIVAGGFIATGPDRDSVHRAREHVRYRIAFYCSTKAYWNVLHLHGLDDLGTRLIDYPRTGRWSEMAALIPDDVVDLFAICAPYDALAERIEERYGGLVDTIELQIEPESAARDAVRLAALADALHRVPSGFTGYRAEGQ